MNRLAQILRYLANRLDGGHVIRGAVVRNPMHADLPFNRFDDEPTTQSALTLGKTHLERAKSRKARAQ